MIMKQQKTDRQSNIELLRFLAILGVIILHYNNVDMGGGFLYVKPGSIHFYTLYFLEALSICAVDLFFIISGYFMATSYRRGIRKPIELLVQVSIFQLIGYLLFTTISHGNYAVKSIIGALIPSNYFVIFYCIIFFLSPYINKLFDLLDYKKAKKLIMMLLFLFTIWTTAVTIMGNLKGEVIVGLDSVGMYGNQDGYTIVTFLLMYIVGVYIRKYELAKKYSRKWKLVLGIIGTVVLVFVWMLMDLKLPGLMSQTAYIYCNPLIVFQAAMLFVLFLNINIGVNKVINKVATGVFTVFLLHGYLIKYIGVERFVCGNYLIMLIHIIVSAVTICLLCTLIHFLYELIVNPLFNLLFRKKDVILVELENKDGT